MNSLPSFRGHQQDTNKTTVVAPKHFKEHSFILKPLFFFDVLLGFVLPSMLPMFYDAEFILQADRDTVGRCSTN